VPDARGAAAGALVDAESQVERRRDRIGKVAAEAPCRVDGDRVHGTGVADGLRDAAHDGGGEGERGGQDERESDALLAPRELSFLMALRHGLPGLPCQALCLRSTIRIDLYLVRYKQKKRARDQLIGCLYGCTVK
jgi:hypothetical protein